MFVPAWRPIARYLVSELQVQWIRLSRGDWLREPLAESPPRPTGKRSAPIEVFCYAHTLSGLEGAPNVLFETARGLKRRGAIVPLVAAPTDGSARASLEGQGIECRVLDLPDTADPRTAFRTRRGYENAVERARRLLEEEAPAAVLVFTLNNFFLIDAAWRAGIPCVWSIHESYDRREMVRRLPAFAFPECEQAFLRAASVVFAARGTRALYARYDRHGDFRVVPNGIDGAAIDARRVTADGAARRRIGAPPGKKVILTVGSVCANKSQATLVRALGRLAPRRDDFCAFIVGARAGEPHLAEVRRAISRGRLEDRVSVVPATPEVNDYYSAADVFVLSSRQETYPLVILEAMAHGLPIVSTRCIGVLEQVRFGENALPFDCSDSSGLAAELSRLLDDEGLRARMGAASRRLFESLPTHDDMVSAYEELLLSAALREGR